MNNLIIEIKNLQKFFGPKKVFDNLCLEVKLGESLVIVGESGCGKSVLLKHLIGLLKPDQGEIKIKGKEITRLSEKELNQVRKKFGMLFQGAALFDSLTVEENVGFPLFEHSSLSSIEIRKKIKEKLKMVGMEGTENLKPAELSGGMKKRIGLARAIVADPEIVLYDEPTTGLDPIRAQIINELIIKMHSQMKITSIIVTHDLKSACQVGNRIAFLHQGKIFFSAPPAEFIKTHHPLVRKFIEGKDKY